MVKTVSAVKAAAEPADEAGAGTKPERRKLVLVAVGVLVPLLVAGSWFLLRGDEDPDEPPPEGVIIDVAQLTANLSGPELHYARVGFAAVLVEGADVGAVEQRFALLKDAALTEIGRFESAKLRTPEGATQLRERLTEKAAELYPDGEVLRIVLTELLVQ